MAAKRQAKPATRPDGKHPARTRRKRKRQPRAIGIWETPTHWNPLTFPAILVTIALGQAVVMSPLYIEIPFLEAHAWLAAPMVFGWLAAVVYTMWRPLLHLRWQVSDTLIQSTQPGRGASLVRTWPNAGFVALEPCGPWVRARGHSGEAHVWPRWLRRSGQMYTFELAEYGRLRLRATTRAVLRS